MQVALRVALLMAAVGCASSIEATNDNFDDIVINSGKNSLVKFLAPWWGHCKSMKPAFDQLAAEYESSSSVNIVDVDCTVHQDVCSKHGVQGYPTIKYWQDGEVKDYNQGRTFDDMKKFVSETLEVKCNVETPEDGCTEKEQKFIVKRKAKSAEDNEKELARLTKMAAGSSMKADLKQWLMQRLNVLKQL